MQASIGASADEVAGGLTSLTAFERKTPARLQASPAVQIATSPKDRPSELPFIKFIRSWGRQQSPINTMEARPNMNLTRSFVLQMQSPKDFAQDAHPGSQVTPIVPSRLSESLNRLVNSGRYQERTPSCELKDLNESLRRVIAVTDLAEHTDWWLS